MKNSKINYNPGLLSYFQCLFIRATGHVNRHSGKGTLWFTIALWIFSVHPGYSQNDSLVDQIYAVLILDSLTVTADQSVPDIKSMIAQTVHDTTFYRAFQRLRRIPFRFSSELYFYKPGWIPHTFMRSLRIQHIKDGKRTNEILEEHIDRNLINRKGEYKFYTAQMYDRIFFTDHPVPVPIQWDTDVTDRKPSGSRIEKYVQDLKLLLFAPGTPIDLPLMGNKTAIFSPTQMEKYDYNLLLDTVSLSAPVYRFQIIADPAWPEDETVIRELTTVFDQKTGQVLSRSYRLTSSTLLYSFDVSMFIRVAKTGQGYIPTEIEYKGWWDIPFKRPEWCRFLFQIEER